MGAVGVMAVEKKWGRNSRPSTFTILMSALIMFICPLVVIFAWNICHRFGGNMMTGISEMMSNNVVSLMPNRSFESSILFVGWLLFQALLYVILPAPLAEGQQTPAGHVLKYKVNGLKAWLISNAGLLALSLGLGLFPLSVIANHWEGLLVAANVYGFSLAGFAYLKARLFPSHPADCKVTGSCLYDLFMGIELNPRFGKLFDFKLFHNGRPGIVAWTMINMSFAAAQYERLGTVTDSMILVNFLQALYVVDFFVHEDWYLKTIDIAHDHFGFMLAWGDSVWLPFMYTLQAQYLAYNPVHLGVWFRVIACIGVLGYCIFREANFQKDYCRRMNGQCQIWGKSARILWTAYKSADGKSHRSLLLTSGLWGIARHCNYLGDLILSATMCMACGIENAIPYFYIIYMTILLVHRVERDHARCSGKYGKYWEEYCRIVPSRLVPGIY